jgi:hypothetical protein
MKRPVSMPDVITAPRTDPIYNCHPYLTKVPIGGIVPLIEAFTRPGDLVVDMFAGSGMTGIASAILGRVARLSDISVLASGRKGHEPGPVLPLSEENVTAGRGDH